METRKVNILVVDDYPANLIALGAVLSDPIYNIIEATSGAEALDVVNQNDIALILLDVQMPEMDGYEVARQLRSNPRTHDIPIIFITAVHQDELSVLRGYEVGAQDYLGKPFDPKVLMAKVGIYSNLFLKTSLLEEKNRQLTESEEHYRLIVEDAWEIIATINTVGTITSLNLAFEKLTGHKSEIWIGKSFIPLIDPKDIPVLLSCFGESPLPGKPRLLDTRIRTFNEQWIPVEISIQSMARKGKFLDTVGTIRDISPRKATR